MRLICEYYESSGHGSRRQLFTIHETLDESTALDFINSLPGYIPGTLEYDDSLVLNSPYLPPNPIRVWGCIDSDDRYRYFYLYAD